MKANADMVLCWLNQCIKLGSYASKCVYQDLLAKMIKLQLCHYQLGSYNH